MPAKNLAICHLASFFDTSVSTVDCMSPNKMADVSAQLDAWEACVTFLITNVQEIFTVNISLISCVKQIANVFCLQLKFKMSLNAIMISNCFKAIR